MKTDQLFYKSALLAFSEQYLDQLSELYNIRPGSLKAGDMVIILEYTANLQMESVFEFNGRLGQLAINEIRNIPESSRSLEKVAKSIAHHEVGLTINRPLHKSLNENPDYGKLLQDMVSEWRVRKMRSTFRKLITSSFVAEQKIKELISVSRKYKSDPSYENKLAVKVAINSVNKSLISAHFQARAGAAWSLRAGFTGIRAARAMNSVYIKKINKLAESLSQMDNWLISNGIKSEMAIGINRRKKILNRELMLANSDPRYNRNLLDSWDSARSRAYEHGSLNYA